MNKNALPRAAKIDIWEQLHQAAHKGRIEQHRKLLHAGVAENFISLSKQASVAISQGHLAFVRYLIEDTILASHGQTDLSVFLRDAARAGSIPIVGYLLNRADFSKYSYKGYLDDALTEAAKNGQIVMAEYLIGQGANPFAKAPLSGLTASQTAAKNNQLELLTHLFNQYSPSAAEKQFTMNVASESGHLPVVLYLEKLGFAYKSMSVRKNFLAILHLINNRLPILEHWLQDNKALLTYLVQALDENEVAETTKAWLLNKYLRNAKPLNSGILHNTKKVRL